MSFLLLVTLLFDADPAQGSTPPPATPAATPAVDFARDIQPILKARCYECHGPDAQESGLRLDNRDAALDGGDTGPAIVAGKSGESELIRRVTHQDDDKRMPAEGDRLTKEQIDLLRRWIDGGATWPEQKDGNSRVKSDHWSFQPLHKPAVPQVANTGWVRNEIDAFVLAKLASRQTTAAPEADRATLLRRLSLDLLGLPPTLAQQEAFLNDGAPDAYERLVDSLLASKHFGERWGRHWLDLARYADSNGYERDDVRPNAFRYRDWVVEAINNDLSYDRFIVEQLAGDLLPNATLSQKVATGFYRMTIKNTESGINKEDYRNREVIDRLNTVGTAFLGLTVGCAQCHSHKYDPLSQREYYQLYSFFNNLSEADVDVPGTPAEEQEYRAAMAAHEKKEILLKARQDVLAAMAKQGVDHWRDDVPAQIAKKQRQRVALATIQKLPQDAWHRGLPAAAADDLQLPADVKAALADDEKTCTDAQRKLLKDYHANISKQIDAIEKSLRTVDEQLNVLDDAPELLAALRTPKSQRSEVQQSLVAEFEKSLPSRLDDLGHRIRHLAVEQREIARPQVMMVAEDSQKPRQAHVLLRGDFKQQGRSVVARTPAVFHPLAARGKQADRLDLANWLVDPQNPLSARVAVNHAWQHLFGQGLVATTDDFGVKGERPSHPELLNWLAVAFRESGWSRKQLIRLIVTSSTYRQSSSLRPELEQIDPLNTLLGRQGRFRVEGEVVRDLFLSASGLLDPTVGGKTIHPQIPESVRALGYKYQLIWQESGKPERYRRGMYIAFKRSVPYPSLVMFDAPDGNLCAARRNRSNTPLQALTTLNDPVFVECAQAFSRRILREAPSSVHDRLTFAARVCLARDLNVDERNVLLELYRTEHEAYASAPDEAARFVGEYAAEGYSIAECAAWTAVARTLLNLDQFVTRE